VITNSGGGVFGPNGPRAVRNRGPHDFGPHGHVGHRRAWSVKPRERQKDVAESGRLWGRMEARTVPRKGGAPSQNRWMQDYGKTAAAQRSTVALHLRLSRKYKSPHSQAFLKGFNEALHPRNPKGTPLAGKFRRK
jgi:hypothetical protein